MKKRFGLFMVAIFIGILTVLPTVAQDEKKTPKSENIMLESRYQVSGDRQGKVTVTDTTSGKVIRTFQMDSGVVRETFLLDNGRTVAASQKDHAVFWDLETGREIGRVNQRIRGFSPDQTNFFTQNNEGLFLYDYPNLVQKCKLTTRSELAAGFSLFSPNDRFMFIEFSSAVSIMEMIEEIDPDRQFAGSSISYTKLLNIQTCQEIQEFSDLKAHSVSVEFSPDSRFLVLKDAIIFYNGHRPRDYWRFDLTTYKVEKLVE